MVSEQCEGNLAMKEHWKVGDGGGGWWSEDTLASSLWKQVTYQMSVNIAQVSMCLLWDSGSLSLDNSIPKKVHNITRSKAFSLGSMTHTLKINK